MRDDSVYLHHMVDAIRAIAKYIEGVDVEEFRANDMMQDAVVRQISIVGEAAKRVSAETRSRIRMCRGGIWPGCATNSCTTTSVSMWIRFG